MPFLFGSQLPREAPACKAPRKILLCCLYEIWDDEYDPELDYDYYWDYLDVEYCALCEKIFFDQSHKVIIMTKRLYSDG